MFNNPDFYPTPPEVIQRMVVDLELFNKTVLEPSAGSGNILDYVSNLGAKTIACELDKNLSEITKTKCDQFLCYDFLDVTSEQISHIDYIIMNPPFSQDEKHIIHAWEITPEGCTIKALCNWEALDNRFSRSRRNLDQIIRENGQSENLEDCFSTAERKTDVNIGLVTLYKPKTGNDEFDGYFDMIEDEERQSNGLIQHNEIREIVNRYVGAIKMFDEVEEISSKINELASPFSGHSNIRFGAYAVRDNHINNITREVYKKDLQKAAWKSVFAKLKMDKYVTRSVLQKLNKFVEKQSNVPFKMSNIFKMVDMIYQTYEENMNKAIIEIFDKLTCHSSENRYEVESWVSNSHYLISKKFIMPWMADISFRGAMGIKHNGNYELLDDLTKALCFLTGKRWEDIGSIWRFFYPVNHYDSDNTLDFGKWYEWGFFELKGYKKATMHFRFKNEDHWAILNQRIAKIKGLQLPKNF